MAPSSPDLRCHEEILAHRIGAGPGRLLDGWGCGSPPEPDRDLCRRPWLRRPGGVRPSDHHDAPAGPHGPGRAQVHPVLHGCLSLYAFAGRASHGKASDQKWDGVRQPARPFSGLTKGPASRGNHAGRSAEGAGIRHGGHREVAFGAHAGIHCAPARIRLLLRIAVFERHGSGAVPAGARAVFRSEERVLGSDAAS